MSGDVFAEAIEQARVWVGELAESLGVDKPTAYRALRVTLYAIRDRLTVNTAVHLSAQLPLVVRGLYFEGWDPAACPAKMHAEEGPGECLAGDERGGRGRHPCGGRAHVGAHHARGDGLRRRGVPRRPAEVRVLSEGVLSLRDLVRPLLEGALTPDDGSGWPSGDLLGSSRLAVQALDGDRQRGRDGADNDPEPRGVTWWDRVGHDQLPQVQLGEPLGRWPDQQAVGRHDRDVRDRAPFHDGFHRRRDRRAGGDHVVDD
jgi:hypothetical protein